MPNQSAQLHMVLVLRRSLHISRHDAGFAVSVWRPVRQSICGTGVKRARMGT